MSFGSKSSTPPTPIDPTKIRPDPNVGKLSTAPAPTSGAIQRAETNPSSVALLADEEAQRKAGTTPNTMIG